MNWSDIPRHPSQRTLRQFACAWICFFGGLALWNALTHKDNAFLLALLALTVGPIGLVAPALLRPIFVGWMIAVFPLGWLMSRAVLGCLFYGLFTPLAYAFRLYGRDALGIRPQRDRESYWLEKPALAGAERYFRQF